MAQWQESASAYRQHFMCSIHKSSGGAQRRALQASASTVGHSIRTGYRVNSPSPGGQAERCSRQAQSPNVTVRMEIASKSVPIHREVFRTTHCRSFRITANNSAPALQFSAVGSSVGGSRCDGTELVRRGQFCQRAIRSQEYWKKL